MNSANRISRRTILRGAGVAMALPLLDVMAPSQALASSKAVSASGAPIRMAWIFFPNGTNAEQWLPKADGGKWEVTPGLKPLEKHYQHLTAFRGLAQMTGFAMGDGLAIMLAALRRF